MGASKGWEDLSHELTAPSGGSGWADMSHELSAGEGNGVKNAVLSFIHAMGAPSRYVTAKTTQGLDALGVPDGPKFGGDLRKGLTDDLSKKVTATLPEWSFRDPEVTPKQMVANGAGFAADPLNYIAPGARLAGKAIEGTSSALSTLAKSKAFKALGPYQKDMIRNASNANDIGGALLENNVIGWIPKSHAGLAESADSVRVGQGEKIDQIINEISQHPELPKAVTEELAAKMASDVKGDARVPGVSAKNNKMAQIIDEFKANNASELPIRDVNDIKVGTGKEINWQRPRGADIPVEEQAQRSVYSALQDAEEKIAQHAADSGIEAASGFPAAKKTYGQMKEAVKIADNRSSRELANRSVSLTDYGSAGLGQAVGGATGIPGARVVGGIAGAAINKLARTYGNQVVAKASDAIARKLMQSKALTDLVAKAPSVYPALVEQEIGASAIDRRLDPKTTRTLTGGQ